MILLLYGRQYLSWWHRASMSLMPWSCPIAETTAHTFLKHKILLHNKAGTEVWLVLHTYTTKVSNFMISSWVERPHTCLFLCKKVWQNHTPMKKAVRRLIKDCLSSILHICTRIFKTVFFPNKHATTTVLVQPSLRLSFSLQTLLLIMVVMILVLSHLQDPHIQHKLNLADTISKSTIILTQYLHQPKAKKHFLCFPIRKTNVHWDVNCLGCANVQCLLVVVLVFPYCCMWFAKMVKQLSMCHGAALVLIIWCPIIADSSSLTIANSASLTVQDSSSPTDADSASLIVQESSSPPDVDSASPTVQDRSSPTVADIGSPTARLSRIAVLQPTQTVAARLSRIAALQALCLRAPQVFKPWRWRLIHHGQVSGPTIRDPVSFHLSFLTRTSSHLRNCHTQ